MVMRTDTNFHERMVVKLLRQIWKCRDKSLNWISLSAPSCKGQGSITEKGQKEHNSQKGREGGLGSAVF